MSRAIAVAVRRAIVRRWRKGQSPLVIAEALHVAPRTVRHLIQTLSEEPSVSLAAGYDRCGPRQPRSCSDVLQAAVALRREHSRWGAEWIRLRLSQDHPDWPIPSSQTLRKWIRRAGLGPAPRGRKPASETARARRPHEIWQMDASERMRLKSGREASWLRIVDEYTGAVLKTVVFSRSPLESHPGGERSRRSAAVFCGLGTSRSVPRGQRHALGFVGRPAHGTGPVADRYGHQMIWNPPGQPQKNGVVERSQGVGKNWCEPQSCPSVRELQRRADEADRLQRERYPYQKGAHSRWQMFPGLKHSGRPYDRDWEQLHWSFQQALEHLAQYVVQRRVNSSGDVSLHDRHHYVGQLHTGTNILIYFDPQSHVWVYSDEHGRQLRARPAEEITPERICNMDISHRRTRPPRGPGKT